MKNLSVLILCFLATSVMAEVKPAYLGFGVENLTLTGVFETEVPLGTLFDPNNVAHFTNSDGKTVLSQIDKKTLQGNTTTYLMTTKVDKKIVLKMSVRFTLKEAEELATMTYIKVTSTADGKFSQAEFDGTESSLGRVLGIFSGMASSFLDVEKINQIEASR